MADLGLYDVTVNGTVTQMQLTKDDAESLYGDDAKRVGSVETTKPEPVDHGDDPEQADGPESKQAEPARNKARSTKS